MYKYFSTISRYYLIYKSKNFYKLFKYKNTYKALNIVIDR